MSLRYHFSPHLFQNYSLQWTFVSMPKRFQPVVGKSMKRQASWLIYQGIKALKPLQSVTLFCFIRNNHYMETHFKWKFYFKEAIIQSKRHIIITWTPLFVILCVLSLSGNKQTERLPSLLLGCSDDSNKCNVYIGGLFINCTQFI